MKIGRIQFVDASSRHRTGDCFRGGQICFTNDQSGIVREQRSQDCDVRVKRLARGLGVPIF